MHSSHGILYQGYLNWLWSLQSPWHGRSRIGIYGGVWKGSKQRARTGTVRRKSLGKRGGMERSLIGKASVEGPATWMTKILTKQSILVGYVSEYGHLYRWGDGVTDRGWYVGYVLEHTTSRTVGTGDYNPPCTECPRPTWNW